MTQPNPPGSWAQTLARFGASTLAQLGFPRLQQRAEFRSAWGHAGDKDGWLASRYFDLTRSTTPEAVVDDRTWGDLEFPRIFGQMDTAVTPAGRQYLFRQLRTYEFDPERIAESHALYEALRSDAALREEIQLTLAPLNRDATHYIPEMLLGPAPALPRHHALILPWIALTVLSVMGVAVHFIPLWVCACVLIANVYISIKVHPLLEHQAEALASCRWLLGVARKLSLIRASDGRAPLTRLRDCEDTVQRLAPQMRVLGQMDRLRDTGLVAALIILLNVLFLARLAAYTQSLHRFLLHRDQWRSLFDRVAEADAAVAIANFLQRHPQRCRPRVSSTAEISLLNAYHPLIASPVPNSLNLVAHSALITGSNMAGKTTFIKTVAINLILGHTLGICLAEAATLPRSGVRALVRGEQSVESGKSRYFAEVEAIRDFIAEAATGHVRVFVLDEPFSGTNTHERLGAARAVLEAIAAHAQILVTTHDIELQQLLGSRFVLYHFQEDPAVKGFFDYRLRCGESTQRNAIKVLERLGFPREIIEQALATIQTLEK